MNYRIKLRRFTAAAWDDTNPVLLDGEPGFDKTHKRLKIGDGQTPWRDLPYIDADALTDHIESDTPHPIYDDGPSLSLLYENAKV